MNLVEWILRAGAPDAPALIAGEDIVTYAALRRAVGGWACALSELAVAKGEHVGLLAPNGPLFVAAYLGTIRAGLCVVPFQLDSSQQTLERIITTTGMKRIVVQSQLRPRIESLAARLGVALLHEDAASPAVATANTFPAIDPVRDLAAVMPTSGTTGEPRGVMITHRNIATNTADIIRYMGLQSSDRAMVVLPLSYCFGASLMHTLLAVGGSLVFHGRFVVPEKMLDEMVETECTGLAGVPSTYQILLRKTRFTQRRFPTLRWLQQAGGRLPTAAIREICETFPHMRLFVMYGQTEATARLSFLPPKRLVDKAGAIGSVGCNLEHTRIAVLKQDGMPVAPGSDEIGEIVASGENIAAGYWNDPEETSRYFRDGKLYTGDMARVDRDGFIFIVERSRDFIKPLGNRVSPTEIEDVIAEMPEVAEVAVIGVRDEIWGEAIQAFVVNANGQSLTADDVRKHCLKRLPNYKIPQYIEFLPSLPKTSNGKVAKAALQRITATQSTDDR